MKELPIAIQDRIDRYMPITAEGLTLWPVTVKQARQFSTARIALDIVVQSLPVALLSMPLMDAFYQLDNEEMEQTGTMRGLLASTVLLLALSLRLGDTAKPELLADRVRIFPDEQREGRIREIVFLTDDGMPLRVTPRTFQKIRPLIAAQNGVEMPSVTANPEILQMERLKAQKELNDMDPRLTDKIIFVAQSCGISEEEIWDWPILKLERHAASASRRLDYLAVQIATLSGFSTFKDGNPVPSPYFARKRRGLQSVQKLGNLGAQAEAAVRRGDNAANKTQTKE